MRIDTRVCFAAAINANPPSAVRLPARTQHFSTKCRQEASSGIYIFGTFVCLIRTLALICAKSYGATIRAV